MKKRNIFCLILVLIFLCSSAAYAVATPTPAPPKRGCSHVWGAWHYERGDAICGQWGVRWRTCTICGEEQDEDYLITHDWSDWKIEYPPKDGNPGMLYRKCKICGKIEYKYYWEDATKPAISLKVNLVSDPQPVYHEGDKLIFVPILQNTGDMEVKYPTTIQYKDSIVLINRQMESTFMPPTDTVLFDAENDCEFSYTITKEDVQKGFVSLQWQSLAMPTEGSSTDSILSNIVNLEYPTEEGNPAISLSLTDDFFPGHAYVPGDEFMATLVITNTGNVPLTNLDLIHGFLPEGANDYPGFGELSLPPKLDPGESFTVNYFVSVSAEDMLNGVIQRCWYAEGSWNDLTVTSNETYLNHPAGDPHTDEICNPKLVVNDYGAESEIHALQDLIHLEWTITNVGKANCTLTAVMENAGGVESDVVGDNAGTFLAAKGGSAFCHTTLVLTSEMVKDNKVVVYYQGHVLEEDGTEVFTNIVKKVYEIDPWGWPIPSTISVKKAVTSQPEHGLAYHKGETVMYEISVTNSGNTDITDVKIYDPLCPENGGLVGQQSVIEGHSYHTYTFPYVVTDADVNNGYILNQATATWIDPALEGTQNMQSNEVVVAVAEDEALRFIKTVASTTPTYSNGTYYAKSDTILYTLRFENDSDDPILSVLVFDILDDSSDYFVTNIAPIAAGEAQEITFPYTVTAEDVAAGSVTNVVWVKYTDNKGISGIICADPVTVPTGHGDTLDDLIVSKSLDGAPPQHEDDSYYTEGDVICFMLFVENPTDQTITNIEVYDALKTDGPVDIISALGPHETKAIEYLYTVTLADVWNTYVLNTAAARFNGRMVYSNAVMVDIGQPQPKPYDDLLVTKTEISVPPKGYYEAGDFIDYLIVIKNIGDVPLVNIMVSDILDTSEYTVIIPHLDPQQPFVQPFSYQVTAQDAAAGHIINTAQATYDKVLESGDVFTPIYTSNPVISPTGDGSQGVSCIHELVSVGGSSRVYRTTYCPKHLPIAQAAEQKLTAAVTREEQSAAYTEIKALWMAEIDELYELDTANPLLVAENEAFHALIDAMEAYQLAIGMDELEAQVQIIQLLVNRCADLCFEHASAGQSRKDSYAARKSNSVGTVSTDCAVLHAPLDTASQDVRLTFCGEHAAIFADILAQVAAVPSENTQLYAQEIWMAQLNAEFTARYVAAASAERPAIIAYRSALGAWLSARSALLPSAEPIAQLLEYFVIWECD